MLENHKNSMPKAREAPLTNQHMFYTFWFYLFTIIFHYVVALNSHRLLTPGIVGNPMFFFLPNLWVFANFPIKTQQIINRH